MWTRNFLYFIASAALLGPAVPALADVRPELIEQLWHGRLYGQAFEILSEKSANGELEPERLALLGVAYELGRGVEADPVQAVRLYRQAAKADSARAAYQLGLLYESGAGGVTQNSLTAFSWYEKAATQHPDAAYRYAQGRLANPNATVGPNAPGVVDVLEGAVRHGHADATVLLSRMYRSGQGVPQDNDKALELLTLAKEHPDAQLDLAIMEAERPDTHVVGIKRLRGLHEQGNKTAAAYLGHYSELAASDDQQKRMALRYYEDAGEVDLPWVDSARTRLQEHFRSPEVLGLRLYGSTQAEIRGQLEKLGIPLKASEPGYWDAYDSSTLLEGSRSLTIAYAPGPKRYVAELAYRFNQGGPTNGQWDAQAYTRYDRLRSRLNGKYGQGIVSKQHGAGREYLWAQGRTTILLKRSADNSILLIYRLDPFSKQLAKALAERQETMANDDIAVDAL